MRGQSLDLVILPVRMVVVSVKQKYMFESYGTVWH